MESEGHDVSRCGSRLCESGNLYELLICSKKSLRLLTLGGVQGVAVAEAALKEEKRRRRGAAGAGGVAWMSRGKVKKRRIRALWGRTEPAGRQAHDSRSTVMFFWGGAPSTHEGARFPVLLGWRVKSGGEGKARGGPEAGHRLRGIEMSVRVGGRASARFSQLRLS